MSAVSDLTDVPDAAIIAVLTQMDWPDDREFSAHIEPDGYQLTPPGTYWDMATDVARAAIGALGEEIARAIEARKRPGITAMLEGGWNQAIEVAAEVARETAHNGSEETKP